MSSPLNVSQTCSCLSHSPFHKYIGSSVAVLPRTCVIEDALSLQGVAEQWWPRLVLLEVVAPSKLSVAERVTVFIVGVDIAPNYRVRAVKIRGCCTVQVSARIKQALEMKIIRILTAGYILKYDNPELGQKVFRPVHRRARLNISSRSFIR